MIIKLNSQGVFVEGKIITLFGEEQTTVNVPLESLQKLNVMVKAISREGEEYLLDVLQLPEAYSSTIKRQPPSVSETDTSYIMQYASYKTTIAKEKVNIAYEYIKTHNGILKRDLEKALEMNDSAVDRILIILKYFRRIQTRHSKAGLLVELTYQDLLSPPKIRPNSESRFDIYPQKQEFSGLAAERKKTLELMRDH